MIKTGTIGGDNDCVTGKFELDWQLIEGDLFEGCND